MKVKKKVLVIGTSAKTRGGITAVIKAYQTTKLWHQWNCEWIETHVDKSKLIKLWFFLKSFVKYVLLLPKASLIHVHLSAPMSVKRKYLFLVLAKKVKAPIIIHFHAFSADSTIDKKYFKLYSRVFNMADTIIVLSESWKKGLVNDLNINSDKIVVLYNPCPIVIKNQEVKKTNTILYAGTLDSRKGYKDLIHAFSNIASIYPDWKLCFAGNGEIIEGRKLAEKLNISEQVVFEGWVSGSKKDELFEKAALFCLPSYAEGFPMAVLDAWAYGLPVVTTPVGGIPDVAIDGINMLLFQPGDIKTLSEKLKIIISDQDLRNKICEASIDFSKNKFSLNNIINNLSDIYQKNTN